MKRKDVAGFNPIEYWRQRHRERLGDLHAVGNCAEPLQVNEARYASNLLDIAYLLGRRGFVGAGKSVLDAGCGYGHFASVFEALGCSYHGVDVSPEAVEVAQSRNPNCTFSVGDLADLDVCDRFDLVFCRTVLIHLTSDVAWSKAVSAICTSLVPRGTFLLYDYLPRVRESPAPHVINRSAQEYQALLGQIDPFGCFGPAVRDEQYDLYWVFEKSDAA